MKYPACFRSLKIDNHDRGEPCEECSTHANTVGERNGHHGRESSGNGVESRRFYRFESDEKIRFKPVGQAQVLFETTPAGSCFADGCIQTVASNGEPSREGQHYHQHEALDYCGNKSSTVQSRSGSLVPPRTWMERGEARSSCASYLLSLSLFIAVHFGYNDACRYLLAFCFFPRKQKQLQSELRSSEQISR